MKLNMKRVGICFLFCLIFIVMSGQQVYAKDYHIYISSDEIAADGESVKLYQSESEEGYTSDAKTPTAGGGISTTTSYTLGRIVTTYYLNWFRSLKDTQWSETTLPISEIVTHEKVIDVDKNGTYSDTSDDTIDTSSSRTISQYDYNLLDGLGGSLGNRLTLAKNGGYFCQSSGSTGWYSVDGGVAVDVKISLGEDSYIIHILPSKSYALNYNNNTIDYFDLEDKKSFTEDTTAYRQYRNYMNGKLLMDYLKECAWRGIAAGSVEAGYNIGIPYSTSQRPLSDVMDFNGSGYEFRDGSTISFTFGYFYHPLLGSMYSNKEVYLPSKDEADEKDVEIEDLWVEKLMNKSGIVKNGKLVIPDTFKTFVANLSDTNVNKQGYKLTDAHIEEGVKRFNFDTVEAPKNVMSYNVPLATPYLFTVTDDLARLSTSCLRVIEGYVYCLYNDCIYKDSDMTRVASMEFEVGTPREKIYLYHQTLPGEEVGSSYDTGVALVGVFDECVVDYNTKNPSEDISTYLANIYLTGRKIAFDNGYSDALDIRAKNVNLLYTNSEGGKIAYLPLNILFPATVDFTFAQDLYDVLSSDMIAQYHKLDIHLRSIIDYKTGVAFFKELWDKGEEDGVGTHGEVPTTVKTVKLYIDFGPVTNQDKEGESGATKYAFYCIRNNTYLNDPDLISWLKTDTAQSLTYVNADALLSKILGDFSGGLEKLSYEDWKRMQEIKAFLQGEKDMWIVHVMNIMSILMGVGLIVFAVLFMMAYWVDIFNTFSKVSILEMVSFGNMYPVAEKDTIEMLPDRGGKVKYVTFKDVLILGLIMIAIGILFMNSEVLVSFIVDIYNYIMYLLGGAI